MQGRWKGERIAILVASLLRLAPVLVTAAPEQAHLI
jgi:hypothetical protein